MKEHTHTHAHTKSHCIFSTRVSFSSLSESLRVAVTLAEVFASSSVLMKAGGGCWCWRNWRGAHSIEIPGEPRTTTGLRMKRRAVTTQEAAAEDDRSAGLQIGSVGVRGQLMNTHSKTRLRATEMWNVLPPPGTCALQVASFLLHGRQPWLPRRFYCNKLCILGLYSRMILCSAL